MRRAAFSVFALFCLALTLSGCWRSASYRYKLTLSFNTPDGVKTGFIVAQIDYSEVSFPAQGEPHRTDGQALYIDLGPGRRPVIALLTHLRQGGESVSHPRWLEDDPAYVLVRVCLGTDSIYSWIEMAERFGPCKKPFSIDKDDLPDLVTFADIKDPNSVMRVDSNDLAATLGPGVSWRSMTLETTDAPLTQGIVTHLPWLSTMTGSMRLDGGTLGYGSDASMANQLQRHDFIRTR